MSDRPETLLCITNFPSSVGYAWDHIERLFGRVADHLATHGINTIVAYPKVEEPPRTLDGTAARAVELNGTLTSSASVEAVKILIRRENVKTVYLTDRPAVSLAYARLRRAGVRHVVVHDRTSGVRTAPRGAKRMLKWIMGRTPMMVADTVIAVSDYVARRQIEVGLVPASRVVRVHNAVRVPNDIAVVDGGAQRALGVSPERPLIVSASRASREKGIPHLMRAFDAFLRDNQDISPRPVLVCVGDGPQLAELRVLKETLGTRDDILLPGYRPDASEIIQGAAIVVVPSVWQEAFGNAVLEAMLRAKPVVATRVGGIPEIIEDGVTGILVTPGDERALTDALRQLLRDPTRARALGMTARKHAAARFTTERQLRQVAAVLERGFGGPCSGVRDAFTV
ncbi:MAG: glycosyltransferase family 4 protein [Anaerolineae bacterium]|nr:glycosyltransferase family 4 protein [Gemmatimonadaceae bacterium]